MNNFKPKSEKKIKTFKNDQLTIDGKHNEFLVEFEKNEKEIIPRLKTKILNLQKKIEKTTDEKKIDIQDEIELNLQKIKNIKKKKTDYLLKNSKYIFEYFETKQNITEKISTNNALNTFFKLKDTKPEIKNNIIQKYLQNIGIDSDIYYQKDVCGYCLKGEIIPIEDEGLMMCNQCFKNTPFLVENEKPSYKEPPKEISFYAYKKINHFKEILAQFQGKETTYISDEIIDNIRLQIKRERITLEQMSYNKTKEILKKLRYNKYYEHIAFIKNKLGIPPLVINPEMEELLCNLFMELQAPYAKFCPDYRVNFLNYYYILFKLCELLGETTYLNEIPMLKDREKLIEQDDIWKKMCGVLNWDFKPTIC
jgi:hypothetical protein